MKTERLEFALTSTNEKRWEYLATKIAMNHLGTQENFINTEIQVFLPDAGRCFFKEGGEEKLTLNA